VPTCYLHAGRASGRGAAQTGYSVPVARKRKRSSPKPAKRITRLAFELCLSRLEMARGHDGLLRGEPEPVVVLGVYHSTGVTMRALGRMHVGFAPRGGYPVVVEPEGVSTITAPVLPGGTPHDKERLVMLAIALEDDGGSDVARIYGALQEITTFSCWPRDEQVPNPVPLIEASTWTEPVTRVFVLDEGRDLRALCTKDELIGAALVTMPVSRGRREFRLPFSSERNDWVALLEASL